MLDSKVYMVYVNHVLMHTFKDKTSVYQYIRGIMKRNFDKDKCYDVHVCERINNVPSR